MVIERSSLPKSVNKNLPCEADDREIRFVEFNETMLDDGKSKQQVPVDFGVDMGTDIEHSLCVGFVSFLKKLGSMPRSSL